MHKEPDQTAAAPPPDRRPPGQRPPDQPSPDHRENFRFTAYAALLVFLWTALLGCSFAFFKKISYDGAVRAARVESSLIYDKDYVPMLRTRSLQHRPLPQKAPETDEEPDASRLEEPHKVHVLHGHGLGVLTRIVSPALEGKRRMDSWESGAFARLREGGAEPRKNSGEGTFSVATLDKQLYLRELRPFPPGMTCRVCHSAEDILTAAPGAVSIAVPMSPHLRAAEADSRLVLSGHLGFWLLGTLCIGAGCRIMSRRSRERNLAESRLRELTCELEDRVGRRTRELSRRQHILQTFMDSADAGMYLKDGALRFVLVNRRLCGLLQSSPERLIGLTDDGMIDKELQRQVKEHEERVMLTERAGELEVSVSRAGQVSQLAMYVFPIPGDGERTEGVGGVVVDVDRHKRLEAELRRARERAESANKAKSDFLAAVSKEIRTPLNGVLGMADLLRHSHLSPDQTAMTATIRSSGEKLLAVLNDILDFSTLEAGRARLEEFPFNLRDSVFEAITSLAPAAGRKGVELIVHVAPGLPDYLVGDFPRIRQILLNLLSNAVKFTDRGEVAVKFALLHREEKLLTLRMSVRDSGVGIPERQRETMFAAFERAEGISPLNFGGTGLGLAISARLAEMMRAPLHLESRPGKGSIFWMDLTLPYLSDPRSVPEDGDRPSVPALKNIRALLADNNLSSRLALMEQLLAWGMKVQQCADVDSAMRMLRLAAASAAPVQIVLTDWRMPGKDGDDLAREMAADPALAGTPLVLLASGDPPEGARERFRAVLAKPANPEALLRAVSSSLRDREIMTGKPFPVRRKAFPVSLRVLLAEDMETNQLVASRALKGLGHSVRVVGNGRQALQALARERFDLVLMDVRMPVLDGLEAVKEIRATEHSLPDAAHLPVVAMASHILPGDREVYANAGMDACLTKPVMRDQLAEVIREMIGRFDLRGTPIKTGPDAAAPRRAEEPAPDAVKDCPDSREGALEEPAGLEESHEDAELLDEALMFRGFGRDPDFIRAGMRMFLRDAPGLSEKILEAVKRDDNVALTREALALKDLTGFFCRKGLFLACRNLERAGLEAALPLHSARVLRQWAGMATWLKRTSQVMEEYLEDQF